jgi:hypothetical protein
MLGNEHELVLVVVFRCQSEVGGIARSPRSLEPNRTSAQGFRWINSATAFPISFGVTIVTRSNDGNVPAAFDGNLFRPWVCRSIEARQERQQDMRRCPSHRLNELHHAITLCLRVPRRLIPKRDL